MRYGLEAGHVCREPESADFQDGYFKASGCWMEANGNHVEQVCGDSGVYLVETTPDGRIVRDDCPWQMGGTR